jgi:hypothetical protein
MNAARIRSLRRRSRERGAAVFIVVMVIALLTGIGIFAARSASLVDTAAGYERQMLQTEYVAQYGTLATAAELGSGSAKAYVDQMSTGQDDCRAVSKLKPAADGAKPPCYKLFMSELSARVNQNPASTVSTLFDPPQKEDDVTIPGSLGSAQLDGNFVIEMTDPGPVERPIPGESAGGSPRFLNYLKVTLSGYGQVRSATGDNVCDEGSSTTAAVQAVRAHALIGPF